MGEFLIYGANGYTARLAAEHAVERGLKPVLAGRSEDKVRPLADQLGLEHRIFDLGSEEGLRIGLAGIRAVLHAAGPFSATAAPMVAECLRSQVHYIDITGEIDVFEALSARDGEARQAAVTLLPGSGFDVVPSDCLAAHVARRLPAAVKLRLSLGGFGGFSRGTAKTMLESVALGTRIRRGGRIVELDETPSETADFGDGARPTLGVSWGDVATAWRSTRIPDIAVFFEASSALKRAASTPKLIKKLMSTGPAQRFLKRQIERKLPEGPSRERRAQSRSIFLAEAWDADGSKAVSRLETMEAYTLSAWTAVEIARRAAVGEVPIGYQTPATAFGPDFILTFPGSVRIDL